MEEMKKINEEALEEVNGGILKGKMESKTNMILNKADKIPSAAREKAEIKLRGNSLSAQKVSGNISKNI